MSQSVEGLVADLLAERTRLDQLLDEALEQFALYEEGMNARMKRASPDEMPALMEQRGRMEETLGIASLVDRIDAIREQVSALRAGGPAV